MPSFEQVCNSHIARVITFVLTPLLLPIAASVANWVQDAAGLDLNGADLTAFVVSTVIGVAIVVLQWVRNRGRWEVAVAEISKVHDLGASQQTTLDIPPNQRYVD